MMVQYPLLLSLILIIFFNIKVIILIDSLNIMSAAINAVCLALLDAGLPLNYVPVSTTCIVNKNLFILLDPTEAEEQVYIYIICFIDCCFIVYRLSFYSFIVLLLILQCNVYFNNYCVLIILYYKGGSSKFYIHVFKCK
jgi:hypothetical protein